MLEDSEGRLRKIEEVVQENRKILKRLQRQARWGRFWGYLKWSGIIIGTLVGYYYAQPYIDATRQAWQQIQETAGTVGGFLGN